ncbi:MAG: sigma-54 dependent transcriptional regulator [Acidobacteriota bacterium]
MPAQGRVLLIDNRISLPADSLQALEASGFDVTYVETGDLGLRKLREISFDVVLLNLDPAAAPDKELVARIKQESPNTALIVLYEKAAGRTIDDAVRESAFDCLAKPFTPEFLSKLVVKAAGHAKRTLEDSCIGQELERMMLSQVLIGRSRAIRETGRFILKAASVHSSVLVTGEPGAGKEVVARAIHRLSSRSNRPFVKVDCRKSRSSLLENELFGHLGGAIRLPAEHSSGKIERAEGGTLFLDEIAAIGSAVQDQLMQALLEPKVLNGEKNTYTKPNIRIISTSRQDMLRIVQRGAFREDLFYKLNSISIPMPPLRERLEDIPLIAEYYIKKFSAEKQRSCRTLSKEALRSLQRREWPGNVRELIGVLERATARCDGGTIELKDLPPDAVDPYKQQDDPSEGYLVRMEKNEILRILEQFHGNKTKAAQFLGINRKTLREKMERYGLNKT